ncbi:MAG: hypothetical protein AAF492_08285 [Verrucomicrobiota bacterium]
MSQLNARGVKRSDRFWLKSQPYSLADMLDGHPMVDTFVGGDVFQSPDNNVNGTGSMVAFGARETSNNEFNNPILDRRSNVQMDDIAIWNRGLSHTELTAWYGLSYFSGLKANDPAIKPLVTGPLDVIAAGLGPHNHNWRKISHVGAVGDLTGRIASADALIQITPTEALVLSGLALTKSVSSPVTANGSNLTYTIEIVNAHTSTLAGITVRDVLPAEVTFVSALPAPDQINGNEVVFDLGALDVTSNAVITIDVTVTAAPPMALFFTNRVTAITTNLNVMPSNAMAEAEALLVVPVDVLDVTKSVSRFESNYTYTITVMNQSVSNADNVVMIDTLPAGSIFQSATPMPDTIVGDNYTFNLGTMGPGASVPIVLDMVYTSTTPAAITNVAVVSTTTSEDILNNNTAFAVAPTASTNVELVLTKTVSPTNLSVGASNLTYSITVMNISTVFAGSIIVTDALPITVQYLSSSLAPSQTNGNQYAFTINFFGASASTTIVINAAYTGSVATVLTNWATVTGTNTELSTANNTDFAITTVTGAPPCVPGTDTDGDGMDDCDEICAGTDPMNPTDFLWLLIEATPTQSIYRFTFPTVLGRTYHLEDRPSLFSNNWNTVISNLPGLGTSRSLLHTSTMDRVYYRIGVSGP